jgi:hypothetical protein
MYAHCECALLWSVQPIQLLSLTPLLPSPHFSTVFNTYLYILYLHILWYAILHALSFFFAFPLSSNSVEWFHCYKHVLHLSLYMIMLVFVYVCL